MVRVLIVDDSPIVRDVLREVLEQDGNIKVVGEAEDGDEVLQRVEDLKPDLITMDVNMPRTSGIEAIRQVMTARPTPILVVTSMPAGPDTDLAYLAIQAGAVDIAEKPYAWNSTAQSVLRTRVRVLANLPVQRHDPTVLWELKDEAELSGATPANAGCQIVGIVASACGASAVAHVLGGLPSTFPGAIAVVPHLPNGFIDSFSNYLRKRTKLKVEPVARPTKLRSGTVYLPANDMHLVAIDESTLTVSDADPVHDHRPSASVLFKSLALRFGERAAGVVLSGLGGDGADGILAMRERRAVTIAQDPASHFAAQMPAAAVDAGGVEHVLPLAHVAPFLLAATGSSDLVASSSR